MAKSNKPSPKTEEAPKEVKKTVAPAKKLILNKTIHIPNVARGNDDRNHLVQGNTYGPGTVVTKAMIAAYEARRKAIGGETPIDAFCE